MKDCKNCEHFDGYDNYDGTPYCLYEDGDGNRGCEVCPFNDTAETKDVGLSCTVDMGQINEYIANTIANTIASRVNVDIDCQISRIIKEEYELVIRKKTDASIDSMIEKQVEEYMSGEMTIGGGWGEKSKTLSRTEYLAETVANELDSKFKKGPVSEMVIRSVKSEIDKRTEDLKHQINAGIKSTFDEVTRKTLAEGVVTMLMCSDTYTKLQNGMTRMLK
jgi:hypothetical protein